MAVNPFNPEQYDTRLSPQEERAFQRWRAGLPRNLQGTSDYDLRGAWKANAKEAANGHLPDTWKKPNHITFSTESQYASPQNPGGGWIEGADGKWIYLASPSNQRYRSTQELQNYFATYEPDARLIPPATADNLFRRRP